MINSPKGKTKQMSTDLSAVVPLQGWLVFFFPFLGFLMIFSPCSRIVRGLVFILAWKSLKLNYTAHAVESWQTSYSASDHN